MDKEIFTADTLALLTHLTKTFASPEVIGNTAVIAIVANIFWFLTTSAIRQIRYYLAIFQTTEELIELAPYKPEYEGLVEFWCLVVRYGTDAYLRDMADSTDRYDGKLINKKYKLDMQKGTDGQIYFKLRLRVHKKLGTQFKCYAEIASRDQIHRVRAMLEKCELVSDITRSGSVHENRLFFLLAGRFAKVRSIESLAGDEGATNNFCYPE